MARQFCLETAHTPLDNEVSLAGIDRKACGQRRGFLPAPLDLRQRRAHGRLLQRAQFLPAPPPCAEDEVVAGDSTGVARAGRRETAPPIAVWPCGLPCLDGIGVNVTAPLQENADLLRLADAREEARLPHRPHMAMSAIERHRAMLLERLHELARVKHPAAVARLQPRERTIPCGFRSSPLLQPSVKRRSRIKDANPAQHLLVWKFGSVRNIGNDVEVVRHDTIGDHGDAGEVGRAPQEVNKARPFPFVQKEGPVSDTTDQVIAAVRLEVSTGSHVRALYHKPSGTVSLGLYHSGLTLCAPWTPKSLAAAGPSWEAFP